LPIYDIWENLPGMLLIYVILTLVSGNELKY